MASFRIVGQVIEPGDARVGRIEVAVATGSSELEGPIVYCTKYRSGQVGERSVGMSPAAAIEIAALLRQAAGILT